MQPSKFYLLLLFLTGIAIMLMYPKINTVETENKIKLIEAKSKIQNIRDYQLELYMDTV